MNINAAIIDQRLNAVMEHIKVEANEELKINQSEKLKTLAFVYLCVQTMLDLPDEEAFDCLTEGGGDFGVDAIHFSDELDGEFNVTIFQGKYKKSLEGNANFPEEGIKALINAVRYLFDPTAELNHINQRLTAKVEEVRSMIRDGYIPQVRLMACNNGIEWSHSAQEEIDRSGYGNQVIWEHVNHDRLVTVLQSTKTINDTLRLSGKAINEDFNYSRVLVARISVKEIAELIERHGQLLLERNIRRFLGMYGNRVNEAIRETLLGTDSSNFYFYNNGITMICDKFSYNALQQSDYQVQVENLQIINGGQTCMTIHKTVKEADRSGIHINEQAFVMLRLYQLPSQNDGLVQQITFATNNQNPVDMRDLRANDEIQKRLEIDIQQLGFNYRRKRMDSGVKPSDITSGTAAEAILSVWRHRPHQAKFLSREHFGKLYPVIFTQDLNGAQVIIATLIYRIAENRRKRPDECDPSFVRYASCFLAMQMSRYLLKDVSLASDSLSHEAFERVLNCLETNAGNYFERAKSDIQEALRRLYGEQDISMQQLSATFRRGDLIEILESIEI